MAVSTQELITLFTNFQDPKAADIDIIRRLVAECNNNSDQIFARLEPILIASYNTSASVQDALKELDERSGVPLSTENKKLLSDLIIGVGETLLKGLINKVILPNLPLYSNEAFAEFLNTEDGGQVVLAALKDSIESLGNSNLSTVLTAIIGSGDGTLTDINTEELVAAFSAASLANNTNAPVPAPVVTAPVPAFVPAFNATLAAPAPIVAAHAPAPAASTTLTREQKLALAKQRMKLKQ